MPHVTSDEMTGLIADFEARFGVGACGAVAVALRDAGVGQIQVGQYGPAGDYFKSFPHYWIKRPAGTRVDLVNPELGRTGWMYWDVEDLRPDEPPDGNIYGPAEVAFVVPYLRRDPQARRLMAGKPIRELKARTVAGPVVGAGRGASVRWTCVGCGKVVTSPDQPRGGCPGCGGREWQPAVVTSDWGRPGTASEAYKRLIMKHGADTGSARDLIHDLVTRELGAAKAGPPSYVGWYLNWLVKHGHRPPTSK